MRRDLTKTHIYWWFFWKTNTFSHRKYWKSTTKNY